MTRATLTTPWDRTTTVLLTDQIDELEIGSSPSFIEEESNRLIKSGRATKVIASQTSGSFWTDEGEWKLTLVV